MDINEIELGDGGRLNDQQAIHFVKHLIQKTPLLMHVTVDPVVSPTNTALMKAEIRGVTSDDPDKIIEIFADACGRDIQELLFCGDKSSEDGWLKIIDGLKVAAKPGKPEASRKAVIFADAGYEESEVIAAALKAGLPFGSEVSVVSIPELDSVALYVEDPEKIKFSIWRSIRLTADPENDAYIVSFRLALDTSKATIVSIPISEEILGTSPSDATTPSEPVPSLAFGDKDTAQWLTIRAGQDIDGAPENDLIRPATENLTKAERAARLSEDLRVLNKLRNDKESPIAVKNAASTACAVLTSLLLDSWTVQP